MTASNKKYVSICIVICLSVLIAFLVFSKKSNSTDRDRIINLIEENNLLILQGNGVAQLTDVQHTQSAIDDWRNEDISSYGFGKVIDVYSQYDFMSDSSIYYILTSSGKIILSGTTESPLDEKYQEVVSWNDVNKLVLDNNYVFGLSKDGSLLCCSETADKLEINPLEWKNIKKLSIVDPFLIALHFDGTFSALEIGDNTDSGKDFKEKLLQCRNVKDYSSSLESLGTANLFAVVDNNGKVSMIKTQNDLNVSSWSNIEKVWAVSTYCANFVVAKDSLGKTFAVVDRKDMNNTINEIKSWRNINSICCAYEGNLITAISEDGSIMSAEIDRLDGFPYRKIQLYDKSIKCSKVFLDMVPDFSYVFICITKDGNIEDIMIETNPQKDRYSISYSWDNMNTNKIVDIKRIQFTDGSYVGITDSGTLVGISSSISQIK